MKSKRIFKPLQVNFETEDCIDLISWKTTILTEPPLTNNLSKQVLELIIETETRDRKKIKVLSNAQTVEKM